MRTISLAAILILMVLPAKSEAQICNWVCLNSFSDRFWMTSANWSPLGPPSTIDSGAVFSHIANLNYNPRIESLATNPPAFKYMTFTNTLTSVVSISTGGAAFDMTAGTNNSSPTFSSQSPNLVRMFPNINVLADRIVYNVSGIGGFLQRGDVTTTFPNAVFDFTGSGSTELNCNVSGFNSLNLNNGMLVLATSGTINGGTLQLASNTSLMGRGSITGPVTAASNSTISPIYNGSPGPLTVGDLTTTQANLNFEIGMFSGIINVNGSASLSGPVNISAGPGFGVGIYSLVTTAGSITDNGITLGTFPAGLNGSLSIENNNTLVLTVMPVPEPAACLAIVVGMIFTCRIVRMRSE